MTLLNDTFYQEAGARLDPAGWVLTSVQRYDPTVITGITPSGRAFTLTLDGTTVTLTIAGRVKTRTISKNQWEAGNLAVDALLLLRNDFPANQR